jgi:rare lipoprotein A (peptidoglycan hydrolase)
MHLPRPLHPRKLNRSRWMLALGATLALMLAGCSSQNFYSTPTSSYYTPPESYRGTRTEVASWYGPGFEGRRTSSGEVFHSNELTAASTTLPLGSHAIVTNPDTGRSVVVKINDRGPFVRGRSIDLSHRAAQQIGLAGKGVGRVEVTPTGRSTPTVAARTAVYRYSSVVPQPTHLHYASYESHTYAEHRRIRHYYHHHRYYHHYPSPRMVSNPIGDWLASAVPRF